MIQAEHEKLLSNDCFLESLYSYGQVEKKRENFTTAIDAYQTFLDFIEKNSISMPENTVKHVATQIKHCDRLIEEKIKGAKSGNSK